MASLYDFGLNQQIAIAPFSFVFASKLWYPSVGKVVEIDIRIVEYSEWALFDSLKFAEHVQVHAICLNRLVYKCHRLYRRYFPLHRISFCYSSHILFEIEFSNHESIGKIVCLYLVLPINFKNISKGQTCDLWWPKKADGSEYEQNTKPNYYAW